MSFWISTNESSIPGLIISVFENGKIIIQARKKNYSAKYYNIIESWAANEWLWIDVASKP